MSTTTSAIKLRRDGWPAVPLKSTAELTKSMSNFGRYRKSCATKSSMSFMT
jgi:hypothetical protein